MEHPTTRNPTVGTVTTSPSSQYIWGCMHTIVRPYVLYNTHECARQKLVAVKGKKKEEKGGIKTHKKKVDNFRMTFAACPLKMMFCCVAV